MIDLHSVLHRLNVGGQISNAVIVYDGAVGLYCVDCSHAIFDDKQRNLIAVVKLIECHPQADRVDLPAPLGRFEIGILAAPSHIAAGKFGYMNADRARAVVAETNVVYHALAQQFHVARLGRKVTANRLLVRRAGICVAAARIHISVIIGRQHRVACFHLIERIAGVGVGSRMHQHAADLGFGVDAVTFLDCQCASHQQMVGHLQFDIGLVFVRSIHNARLQIRARKAERAIDLVEGHPVLDLTLVSLKQRHTIAVEELYQLAVAPAVILLHQC